MQLRNINNINLASEIDAIEKLKMHFLYNISEIFTVHCTYIKDNYYSTTIQSLSNKCIKYPIHSDLKHFTTTNHIDTKLYIEYIYLIDTYITYKIKNIIINTYLSHCLSLPKSAGIKLHNNESSINQTRNL